MRELETLIIASGDESCRLELIPEFGGTCNRLRLTAADGKPVDVVAGHRTRAEFETDKYYRGVVLYPYVNRLDKGQYCYRGQSFQFAVNEPERSNSLHGFLMHIEPHVIRLQEQEHNAEVTLCYSYDGHNPGYPFPADIILTYRLDHQAGMSLTFTVKNNHHDTVPLGIGWHPYFTLGQQVDSLKLQLPPAMKVAVNERRLPTGNKIAFPDFNDLTRIGSRQFDDCMALTQAAAGKACTRLYSEVMKYGLEIWQDVAVDCQGSTKQYCKDGRAGFQYVHVFIPPDRASIAIEPVSCGINALNTDENLIYLAPAASVSASCGVRSLYSL